MLHVTSSNAYGVVDYSIDKESDVELLPKRGLTTGSNATLTLGGIMRLWFFTQASEENKDGIWDELK